jgi:hypothetical protein
MHVDYLLKQGVLIRLVAYEVDKDHFMEIEVDQAAPETGIEVSDATLDYISELQKMTTGWVFKIPSVSYDSMYKSEPDVLAITEDQLN